MIRRWLICGTIACTQSGTDRCAEVVDDVLHECARLLVQEVVAHVGQAQQQGHRVQQYELYGQGNRICVGMRLVGFVEHVRFEQHPAPHTCLTECFRCLVTQAAGKEPKECPATAKCGMRWRLEMISTVLTMSPRRCALKFRHMAMCGTST